MTWFYLYAHVWDPPRGLGDRRTRSFISGELGNKSLKLRGNRETRRFWGTGNIGNKYFDFRVFAVRLKKAWVLSLPLIAQRRLWSDWADTQADLSLHWAHSHFVVFFFHVVAQIALFSCSLKSFISGEQESRYSQRGVRTYTRKRCHVSCVNHLKMYLF